MRNLLILGPPMVFPRRWYSKTHNFLRCLPMRRVILVQAILVHLGCDAVTPSPIAGTWIATEWVVTQSGKPPVDVLAEGGSLTITVASNNSTSGSIVVPPALTGGSAVTESMIGTATIQGNTVRFSQAADTFVRDATWTIAEMDMVTTWTLAGTALDVTLRRQ